ncbi:hypothetical protein WS86_28430 [Burkholderia savannae]|nr:hypothetical protein WS86_28430 [Burkholderia savannae]KVK71811.1 hypothetical protein WS91_23335 [Burkholderia sp. MSMB1498]
MNAQSIGSLMFNRRQSIHRNGRFSNGFDFLSAAPLRSGEVSSVARCEPPDGPMKSAAPIFTESASII